MAEDEFEPSLEQQEQNFRWAYGDDAWEAVKAESQRLGRRLTMEESEEIIGSLEPVSGSCRYCGYGSGPSGVCSICQEASEASRYRTALEKIWGYAAHAEARSGMKVTVIREMAYEALSGGERADGARPRNATEGTTNPSMRRGTPDGVNPSQDPSARSPEDEWHYMDCGVAGGFPHKASDHT